MVMLGMQTQAFCFRVLTYAIMAYSSHLEQEGSCQPLRVKVAAMRQEGGAGHNHSKNDTAIKDTTETGSTN